MGGFIHLGLISLTVSVLLFDIGFELTAIVKIGKVENIVHPDDSYQVIVHGDALDSAGFVFDVDLNFYPKTNDRKNKIVGELRVDSIFKVRGQYGVIVDAPINLHEPSYCKMEYSEDEGREVFRINGGDF